MALNGCACQVRVSAKSVRVRQRNIDNPPPSRLPCDSGVWAARCLISPPESPKAQGPRGTSYKVSLGLGSHWAAWSLGPGGLGAGGRAAGGGKLSPTKPWPSQPRGHGTMLAE